MLQKIQMLLLFLFIINENSCQTVVKDTPTGNKKLKPFSWESEPRKVPKTLDDHRLGPKNLTIIPPSRMKESIKTSNIFTGNNEKIHKVYYVIPDWGGSSHGKKTHEVKVRLRTRRHSRPSEDRRERHSQNQGHQLNPKATLDAERRWQAQRLKRELSTVVLANVDKPQNALFTSLNDFDKTRQKHELVSDKSPDWTQKHKVLAGALLDVSKRWSQLRPKFDSLLQASGDVDKRLHEPQYDQEITVKRLKNNIEHDKMWPVQQRKELDIVVATIDNLDERKKVEGKRDVHRAPNGAGIRQRREIDVGARDDHDERWREWRFKRDSDSGVPNVDAKWRERMRSRIPRDHQFVTKSQLKLDRVMSEEPPPVIKVYSMPEESISKVIRAGKSRDFSYSRAPTKRIIYYATLPEIIRRPTAPEWFARQSGAFSQRGIGSSFSNSLLPPFPSGPDQGTADIARIQSAIMDVRPPRDNMTPASPQFTVVDIDRFPSLNDIRSTNSFLNTGSSINSGNGQSLSDNSAISGVSERPVSINSILPPLNNNYISNLATPLQMDGPMSGYQPASYYPGSFPTRHQRFPYPTDGYQPYVSPPNSLSNVGNYKIEHPGGYYNSVLSNVLSPTKYPYYYEDTSSKVDPLKNHLLFSPTWEATARPSLYERITPSTHSTHSVVIDSQSININSTNVTTGNSTRITPPVVTNVTEHYESRE